MLHHSRLAQGDSTMEMVGHLDIPAHGSVKLAPGGYHLMLSHAAHPVKPGDKVPVTLRFADGTTLQVNFSVLPANAAPSG
jgi:copper(I)-binding protein